MSQFLLLTLKCQQAFSYGNLMKLTVDDSLVFAEWDKEGGKEEDIGEGRDVHVLGKHLGNKLKQLKSYWSIR